MMLARPALAASTDLYLAVSFSGQPTALISHVRASAGKLSMDGQTLAELGLDIQALGVGAQQQVALDDLPGVKYRYDAAEQSLDLQVPDSLRQAQRLQHQRASDPSADASNRGLVLNYDAYLQHLGTQNSLSLWSEQRYFNASGVFSNTGTLFTAASTEREQYVRYDSSWRRSDPVALTTWQFGDTINSSLDWSRSVRLGGVQWKSNFALRPDLVTFPLPAFSGSAVVPSAVNLYVNGVQQYSGQTGNGPFIIDQVVPGITGAGVATVVTRDALGRNVSTSVPMYVDTRLAAPGLPSYSVELGYLRHNYGLQSFDYSPRLASSASLRYGRSDTLTLEGHAEATSGLLSSGAGALWRMGQAGVLNGSLALSAGSDQGGQLGLGYQYVNPGFSFDAQLLRASSGFGDLAARDGSGMPTVTDRVSFSLPVGKRQNLSLNYLGYKLPGISSSHIVSVGHSISLSRRLSVTLNVFQDIHDASSRGAFVSVSLALGDRTSVSSSISSQNGQSSYATSASSAPDYGGGWGWAAQRSGSQGSTYQQAQVQYLGNKAQVTATAQQLGTEAFYAADVTGAVVLMDNTVAAARQIGDGFALVSTDGVGGIPVIHENREIGVTDSSGHFLVPDLEAYRRNQLGIDSLGLAADVSVSSTQKAVVPQTMSGVLVTFPVKHYAAASLILHSEDGQLIPLGSQVHHLESAADTLVGYDGITFIDGLQPRNHLLVTGKHLRCEVSFDYPKPKGGTLPTLGPFICHPRPDATP